MINNKLNSNVDYNLSKVKFSWLFPAFIMILICVVYFFLNEQGGHYTIEYAKIQEDLFLNLNRNLSTYPLLQFNLTQLGDVMIFFPLISIFLLKVPRLWEALLNSALLSLVTSFLLKLFFSMPRPAAVYVQDNFTIIGKTLTGSTSLPSGHSIATFVVISTVMFSFMPQNLWKKIAWIILMFSTGSIIAISRVGVGAHYPIDVVVGSSIGYMVTVLGVIISRKIHWLNWLSSKKIYPFIALIFILWIIAIASKIKINNLIIYYISILSLIISIIYIIRYYVQKN